MAIRRKAVVFAAAVLSLISFAILPALPASANPVSGAFVISDVGQGCHAFGTLNGNGSILVTGGCAVVPNSAPGGGVQVFTGGFWSGNKTAGVTICIHFTTITGPQYPDPLCVGPLPVNTGPEVIPDPGGGPGQTLIDIALVS